MNNKAQNDSAQEGGFKICVRVTSVDIYNDLAVRGGILEGYSFNYNQGILMVDLRNKDYLVGFEKYETWELVHAARDDGYHFMLVVEQ